MQAVSSCGRWGLLFVVVCGLLIAVASLVVDIGSRCMGLSSCSVGSVICSATCGIFPGQGLNHCPLHCKVDS